MSEQHEHPGLPGPQAPAEDSPRTISVDRAQYERMLEEWKTLRSAKAVAGGPITVQRPIISKPLPPNYAVWLGPLPPPNAELRFAAKGHVEALPDGKMYQSVDGDGYGKAMAVRGTTNSGITGRYLESGQEDIYFQDTCPANHKYAGRPYAPILCPQHAAYLWLDRGKDREGNRMLVFFLTTDFRVSYERMRDSNMRKMHEQDRDVEEIMAHGEAVPDVALVR